MNQLKYIFLSLGFLVLSSAAHAAPADEMTRRLESIELHVRQIEATQQEILTNQKKILAELDNLRVWIARR